MTRHIQDPRETFYAESVCGDPPTLTGGTGTREHADCRRCIGLYDQQFGVSTSHNSGRTDA